VARHALRLLTQQVENVFQCHDVPLRLGDVWAQDAQEFRIGRVLEHVLLRI